MWRRLIYRILLVLPITLSILLVSLFLFYQLPGLHVLDTREFQVGSDRELILNLRSQQERNPFADTRGLFYVGISPGYLPSNIYDIPMMFRSHFKSLCREVDNPAVMEGYVIWLEKQLQKLNSNQPGDLTVRQMVGLLRCSTKEELTTAKEFVDKNNSNAVFYNVLEANPDGNTPLVKLTWNGKQNIFHRYLEAMIIGEPALLASSGELVRHKFNRTILWTIAYTIPGLVVGWFLVFGFVLWFYDRPRWLDIVDRTTLFWYAVPTFVVATVALISLTSHRYGIISRTFPFPVFSEFDVRSLWDIYRHYGTHLILPMVLFGLSPMLLLYRIFIEKLQEIRSVQPSFRYLLHIGLSSRDFRWGYLSKYLGVASLAVLSNLVVSLLGGSLIIEWVFNVPGLGRYFYTSVVNYDVPSTIFLIVVFTLFQQLGHILADSLISYYYPSSQRSAGLI